MRGPRSVTPAVAPLPTAAIRVASAISEIGRADWDACANPGWSAPPGNGGSEPGSDDRSPYNPFVSWDFLDALEQSGAVGRRLNDESRYACRQSGPRLRRGWSSAQMQTARFPS